MPRTHRARTAIAAVATVAFALALAACSSEASPTIDLPAQTDAALAKDTQTQLQTAVDAAIAASGASGAVVGVWAPWAGTWLTGTGTLVPDGRAVPAEASFKAGALTRPMICDVLYAVAAEGTVSLKDSVTTYVQGLPNSEAVTLGELCDSTSGIASYTRALTKRMFANPERTWNPRELVSYGIAQKTTAAPGARFSDSDTGYVLLGLALERATGRSADALLQKYVFDPIGMTGSTLPTGTPDVDLAGLFSPNDKDGKVACTAPVDVTDITGSAGYTASGVTSDLADLGRYTQALATGARSYDTKSRFDSPLQASADAPSWFTADGGAYQAGTLIGQYGSTPGYLTAAFADRNTGMTVVVVLNNSRASSTLVRSLAWQLAAIASKAPAAGGATAPEAGLPWTAEDMAGQVAAAAVCPLP